MLFLTMLILAYSGHQETMEKLGCNLMTRREAVGIISGQGGHLAPAHRLGGPTIWPSAEPPRNRRVTRRDAARRISPPSFAVHRYLCPPSLTCDRPVPVQVHPPTSVNTRPPPTPRDPLSPAPAHRRLANAANGKFRPRAQK